MKKSFLVSISFRVKCLIVWYSFHHFFNRFSLHKSQFYRKGSLIKFHIQKKPYCIKSMISATIIISIKIIITLLCFSQCRGSDISLCPHAVPSSSLLEQDTCSLVLQFKGFFLNLTTWFFTILFLSYYNLILIIL